MSIIRYDADRQWEQLASRTRRLGAPGCIPRQTVYGFEKNLIPFGEAFPDKLVDEADFKAVIQHCHEAQIFPVYHQHNSWAPTGFQWNQNGLNYCWAWGPTAALMDLFAREGKACPLLSPVTLGWLVSWRNSGGYLGATIRGIMERGIASAEFTPDIHSRNYGSFRPGWQDDAMKHRLAEAWDMDNTSKSGMIQHAVSVLATGTPMYIAYNWWGHALECCGVLWDETKPNNLVWQIRNSHNEDDIIEMTGSKAVPDEAYGLRASLTEAA